MKNRKLIYLLLCICLTVSLLPSTLSSADGSAITTLNVTKTAEWTDSGKTEADIIVTADASALEPVPKKVLILGTLCNGHEMGDTTLKETINTIANRADVTYYAVSAGSQGGATYKTGTVSRGSSLTSSFTLSKPNHYAAKKFITILYDELVTNKNSYDYILLEFDSARVAIDSTNRTNKVTTTSATGNIFDDVTDEMDAVADALSPYYNGKKMIWVTDVSYVGNEDDYSFANSVPNNRFDQGTTGNLSYLTIKEFKALASFISPDDYKKIDTSAKTYDGEEYKDNTKYTLKDINAYDTSGVSYKTNYTNLAALKEFIKTKIPSLQYSLTFDDTVKVDEDLEIVSAKLQTSADNGTTWTDYTAVTPTISADKSSATATVTGLEDSTNMRMVVHAVDKGKFKISTDKGETKKDPNNGPATVTLSPENYNPVEETATTTLPLDWSAQDIYKVTTTVTGGTTTTPLIYAAEGEDPASLSSPDQADYELLSVTVNGTALTGEDFLNYKTSKTYTAENISEDVNVEVVYGDRMGITKSVATEKSPLRGGDTVEYKITVSNRSAEEAAGVSVTDELNENLSYVDGSASNGGTYSDPTITWSNLTVPANGTTELTYKAVINSTLTADTVIPNTANGSHNGKTFSYTINTDVKPRLLKVSYEYVGTVPAGAPEAGSFNNNEVPYGSTYYAVSDPSLPGYIFHGWYNESECTSEYPAEGTVMTSDKTLYGRWTPVISLNASKSVALNGICGSRQNAGGSVTYSVNVTNSNLYADVVYDLVDEVPAGLTNITSVSDGGVYNSGTGKITWQNLTVPANSTKTVTFNATVPSDITAETTYTNKAYIDKAGGESYTGPGSADTPATADFTAVPLTGIKVVKNWSDTWDAHTTGDVYVNIYANGALKEKLTLNYANQYAERSYPALDADGNTIAYTISEMTSGADDAEKIAGGASMDGYTVSYNPAGSATPSVSNLYTITNTYIVTPNDLTPGKAVSTDVARAGDTITYTLTVKNNRTNANEIASNVVIEDIFPEGLTCVGSSKSEKYSFYVDGANAQRYIWTVYSIGPGETVSIDLTVTISAYADGVQFKNHSQLTELNGNTVENGPVSNEVTTDVITLTVNKLWYDSEGNLVTDTTGKPDVTAVLYRDGVRFSSHEGYQQTLNASNGWSCRFDSLKIYSPEDGHMYVYTVEEETLEGYNCAVTYDEGTKSAYGYTGATISNIIKTIAVKYNFVGSSDYIPYGVTPPATETVEYDTVYTPESTAEYEAYAGQFYYFSGWYYDPGCTQKIESTDTIQLNDQTAPTGIYNIYGKWMRYPVSVEVIEPDVGPNIEYKGKWMQDEGTTPDVETLKDPDNDYTFLGYYNEAGELIDPSQIILTQEDYPDGLKLYPKWIKNNVVTYTFIGDTPQGATEPDDDKVVPGTEYTSDKNYGTPAGYKFSGWYTDSTLTNRYVDGTTVTSDIDLYGKWTETNDYTVSKDVCNDGKSISGCTILSNNTVTYFIDVANNNTACSKDVVLVDKVPEGLTLIDNISDGGTYDTATGLITWSFNMAAGGSKQVSFNATVSPGITSITAIENNAYVSTSNGEPYVSDAETPGPGTPDNPAKVSFTGVPMKMLVFTKVWSDTWENHDTVTINLYANGEFIEAIHLDNAEYRYQTRYLSAVDESGNPIEYTYREVYMDTDIGRGGMNGFYQFDYTETSDPELTYANSTLVFTNTYQIQPSDLTINKTAETQAMAGEVFTYTLTVNNTRTYETAKNVTVVDPVPDGLELVGWTENANVVSDGQALTWTISELAPGGEAILHINVRVPSGTTAAEYLNQASISSIGGTDVPEGMRPSSEVTTTVRNFTVTKAWRDSTGNPVTDTAGMPAVAVSLLQNGVQYGEKATVSAAGGWTYVWNQLPLLDANGIPYVYTVTEDELDKYTTVISYSRSSGIYGNAAAEIVNTVRVVTVSYQFVGNDKPSDVNPPDAVTVEYGTQYNAAAKSSAPYYEFAGWYLDKDCTIPYTDGTRLDDTTAPTGSLVLYGKWTRGSVNVSYQYVGTVPYGATLPGSVTIPIGTKYTSAGTQYVSGYTFSGWYLDQACTIMYTEGTAITKDTILYGKWITPYTVVYSGGAVKTGDDSGLGLYAVICLISGIACIAAAAAVKKSKYF